MSTAIEDPKRRLVPRWRRWRDAVLMGDLDPAYNIRTPLSPDGRELERLRREWETNRTIPFAGDFLGVASALGEPGAAKDSAEFILKNRSHSSNAVRTLARKVLEEERYAGPKLDDPLELTEDERRARVRGLRGALRESPRNPLANLDMAREYVALGQRSAARGPIQRALALAPDNRFVLRSAARFFLHIDDFDRAHSILRRADYLKEDPWLLAAEIAVASAAGRRSKHIRMGRQMVDSEHFSPFQVSELAGAIGTLEWEAGNRRVVRRLFKRALVAPTENTVAQAGWISRHGSQALLDDHVLEVPRSYEARAWAGLLEKDWRASVDASWLWLFDEPFAKRPAVFGSWAALSTIADFSSAEQFARQGLVTHPSDFTLQNNLAVALASQDKVDDASAAFDGIDVADLDDSYIPTYLATKGLIRFRMSFAEEGRQFYQSAAAEAKKRGDTSSVVRANLYLAREELRHDRVRAEQLVKEAVSSLQRLPKVDQIINARLAELVLRPQNETPFAVTGRRP